MLIFREIPLVVTARVPAEGRFRCANFTLAALSAPLFIVPLFNLNSFFLTVHNIRTQHTTYSEKDSFPFRCHLRFYRKGVGGENIAKSFFQVRGNKPPLSCCSNSYWTPLQPHPMAIIPGKSPVELGTPSGDQTSVRWQNTTTNLRCSFSRGGVKDTPS